MKGANYRVVLDACLLANHGVCDLFLRLAEHPRLYCPQWSEIILAETMRTHVTKLGWPQELSDSWRSAVETHFPEAMVDDAACLEPVLVNDQKDRHVLACAIRAGAPTLVTFNLRHFQPAALSPWHIHAVHPADYLITLHTISPDVVVAKLSDMARDRNVSVPDLLAKLSRSIPAFCHHVAAAVGWIIPGNP